MGLRRIYYCDWCGVDSPNGDTIPCEWRVNAEFGATGPKEHICGACVKAYEAAIVKVKSERRSLRSPQDPSRGSR
jgi:hypothetical protein